MRSDIVTVSFCFALFVKCLIRSVFFYRRELLKRVTGWECEQAIKGYVQLGVWVEVLFRTPHKKLILSAHDTPQSHHHSYPTH